MKLVLFLMLVSSAEAAIPRMKFMYHDRVKFTDDFYGDCSGTVERRDSDGWYEISAYCSRSKNESHTFKREANDLTLVK